MKSLGEKVDVGLGCRIDGEQGDREGARERGQVDDGSLFSLEHSRENDSGHVRGDKDVDVDEGVYGLVIELVEELGILVGDSDVID